MSPAGHHREFLPLFFKIGIPASLTQVLFPLGVAALTFITSKAFLEAGTIAFSLGFRVEFFGFLPAVGFGFGAMAMIGQSLGAGNIPRAKEVLHKALKYGFLSAMSLGIFAALFAGNIIGLFTTDPEVTKYAQSYMWTVTLSYGFLAAMMVEANAFQAMGKSWPGFWISFIRFFVISVPLSVLLTLVFDFSIRGLWIAIITGNVISAIVGYFWVRHKMNTLTLEKVPVHT